MPSHDKSLPLKTGSTAIFHMEYTSSIDPYDPIPLDGYEIFMSFVHPKTRQILFIASLENGITILDPAAGTYSVNAGDTKGWPLGNMPVDIKYVKDNIAQHTETFTLDISSGIS